MLLRLATRGRIFSAFLFKLATLHSRNEPNSALTSEMALTLKNEFEFVLVRKNTEVHRFVTHAGSALDSDAESLPAVNSR